MGQDCPSVHLYMMHSNNNNNIYIYSASIYYTITGFDYGTTSPDGFIAVNIKYS